LYRPEDLDLDPVGDALGKRGAPSPGAITRGTAESPLRLTYHCQDCRADRLGQRRPSVDHFGKIGVDRGGIAAKRVGIRVAPERGPRISRGIRRLFES